MATQEEWNAFKDTLQQTAIDGVQKVLGVTLDPQLITHVPIQLWPENVAALAEKGLGVRYVPYFELPHETNVKGTNLNALIDKMQAQYPNWRNYEAMTAAEQADHTIPRNLTSNFWEAVTRGEIIFQHPSSHRKGEWLVVETIAKPEAGKPYPASPVAEALRTPDRYLPFQRVKDALNVRQEEVRKLAELGHPVRAHLPTIREYNYLANLEGWGSTETGEWTSTLYEPRTSEHTMDVYSGKARSGGAGCFHVDYHMFRPENVGFRIVYRLGY